MIHLFVYVPESHLAQVKNAMLAAGAGRSARYSHCCWQALGTGQYMPLPGSSPYSGKVERLSEVREYKLEMICNEEDIAQVIAALKQAHPYEEPAYGALSMLEVR